MRKSTRLTSLILLCLGLTAPVFGQTKHRADLAADTAQGAALLKASLVLFDSAKYDAALEKIEQSAALYERSLGKESREYANALYRKAVYLYKKNDYPLALELFQTSLAIQIKVLGENTPDVGRSYNGLGVMLMETGKYDQAIEYCRKSLDILSRTLGPEDLELTASLDNLGKLYFQKQDFALSAESFQKALDIQLKRLGAHDPRVVKSYIGLGELESSRGNYNQAVEYNQRALSALSKAYKPEPLDSIRVYNNMGNAYRLSGEYDKALEYYGKSIFVCIAHFGPDHTNVGVLYNNMGIIYSNKSNYDLALKCYQKVLVIFQKKLGPDHPNIGSIHNNIGEMFRNKGNNSKALEYYQKALAVFQKTPTNAEGAIAAVYANQGIIYAQKGDYIKSLELLQQALDIQQKMLGPQHPDVLSKYLNLGEVCRLKGDYDKSLDYLDKVIALENVLSGQGQEKVATAYHNSGATYALKNDYVQALARFQKGLEIRKRIFGEQHVELSQSYYNIAVCHKFFKDFSASEANIVQAFQALPYSGATSLPQVESIMNLLQTLMLKGVLFREWYLHDGDPDHLQTARQALIEANTAIEYQHNTFENPGAKYTLANEVVPLYEVAIATDLLLLKRTDSMHYAVEAFNYAEKTKSHILYGAMQESQALQFAGLPDSLLRQEQDLRIDITFYEKSRQVQFSQGLTTTDSALVAISAKLFDLNQQYEALKKRFERDFPDYYRLRYDLSTASISEVQEKLLQPGQTLLEYFTGDSSVFAFVIRPDYFDLVEIKKDFPLEKWVAELRQNMLEKRSTGASEYCNLAHQLYQKLVMPVKDKLTEDLIIIPDGVLGYLSFEALLIEKPKKPARFSQHKYMLNEHRVSYCYSATLWRELLQKERRDASTSNSLAAFAPFYSGDTTLLASLFSAAEFRKDLQPLKSSGLEVFGIQKILGGAVFYGGEATKERFLAEAGKADILHLATHGRASDLDGDYSFLVFSEGKDTIGSEVLYVRDIYNLTLNADLVTLSACETGIGQMQRGEGVISLARAFAYAGAGSIVTSLWSVHDEHTKDLMILFYKHLRKGLSKSEALRQAKLSLVKHPDSHPFFWAAFIGIGDMRPLAQTGK